MAINTRRINTRTGEERLFLRGRMYIPEPQVHDAAKQIVGTNINRILSQLLSIDRTTPSRQEPSLVDSEIALQFPGVDLNTVVLPLDRLGFDKPLKDVLTKGLVHERIASELLQRLTQRSRQGS